MKRTGTLLLIALCISLAACGDGDDDDDDTTPEPPDPSVSAVNPPLAYLGRTMDVTISGSNTSWGSDVAIDFGAGITVSNVRVGSETGLVATITIADDAGTGVRNVIVGGQTYTGAFSVQPPITVSSIEGTPAQGSVVFGTVRMHDLTTPFDTTRTGDGLFNPFVYTNLDVTTAGGTESVLQGDPTAFSLAFATFIDVMAPAGPVEMSVASGPAAGDRVGSTTPAAFEVAARTPVALTEDAPASSNVTKPFDSVLYSMMTTAGKIVTVTIDPVSAADASPGVAILPMSGAWADWVNGDFTPTAKFIGDGSLFYAVAVDLMGEAGYMHTIEFVETDPPEADDTANNACAGAIAATPLPYNQADLILQNQADADWFAVTVTAADIGKTIHAITSPGQDNTDTVLEIFGPGCTTAFGAASTDQDYHEDLESPAIIVAGTYYVKVTHSQAFPHAGSFYTLSIALEGP